MHRFFARFPSVVRRLPVAMVATVGLLAAASPAAATALPSAATPAAEDRPVRVLSYDIAHGQGVDRQVDLDRIATEIRESGADIVGLQEVDRHFGARSPFVDQASVLAEELRMHVVYGANLDFAPLTPGEPRRQYGTAILSETPIHEWRNTLLPRTGNFEQRVLLEALVTVRGVPVRVFNTHLQHNNQNERLQQVAAIRELIGVPEESVVLTGDLNADPSTPEIAAVTQGLIDAWAEVGVGDGHTYSSTNPYTRIDYVMPSDDVVARTAAVLATDDSDHLPVVADLALPGNRVGAGASVRPTG